MIILDILEYVFVVNRVNYQDHVYYQSVILSYQLKTTISTNFTVKLFTAAVFDCHPPYINKKINHCQLFDYTKLRNNMCINEIYHR